jgi:hypothetical protein
MLGGLPRDVEMVSFVYNLGGVSVDVRATRLSKCAGKVFE